MTGSGAEVGDVVVDHAKTRFVAFTGSKEIGLRINERAAKVQDGQIWIKRVVAEMGGKDAILARLHRVPPISLTDPGEAGSGPP